MSDADGRGRHRRGPRRVGRRPGGQDTRAHILRAARARFGALGYDRTTVRAVADDADVDPALVHHYFGSKEALFRAVVRPPVDPAAVLPAVLSGDVATIGERVVRTFLGVWDAPATGPAFRSLLRGALTQELTATLVRDFVTHHILRHLGPVLVERAGVRPEEVPHRTGLVASQLFGLAAARYLLRLDPLATAEVDDVVAAVAPTVQRYLVEPLDGPTAGPAT